MAAKPLNVAIIGAGEVAQVIHLQVLLNLQHYFVPTIIADVSPSVAEHCARKFKIPKHTTDVSEIFSDSSVDIVFNLTSDAYHAEYTIQGLKAGKHVFVEKPFTLSIQAAQRVIQAERESGGKKVFVGYMRRYAESFTGAFKREVATIPKILYARCRDFSGPNAYFVNGSGAMPFKNTKDIPAAAAAENQKLLDALLQEALREHAAEDIPQELIDYCRFLNTLGSHDISLMRETLGMPTSVDGVSLHHPFYSAIFHFDRQPNSSGAAARAGDSPSSSSFSCTYETGVDGVPKFDAHLAVYGERKRVEIAYDSPFVKGLAIRVKVDEVNDAGEIQSREVVSSYEDAFTAELREVYECFARGKAIKTSAEDALGELMIYDMMYKAAAAAAATRTKSTVG